MCTVHNERCLFVCGKKKNRGQSGEEGKRLTSMFCVNSLNKSYYMKSLENIKMSRFSTEHCKSRSPDINFFLVAAHWQCSRLRQSWVRIQELSQSRSPLRTGRVEGGPKKSSKEIFYCKNRIQYCISPRLLALSAPPLSGF